MAWRGVEIYVGYVICLEVFQSPLYIACVGGLATDDQHDQSKRMLETVMGNPWLWDMLVLSALGLVFSLWPDFYEK